MHNAYYVVRDSTLAAGSQWKSVPDTTALPSSSEDYVRTIAGSGAMSFDPCSVADSVALQMNNPRNTAANNIGPLYEQHIASLPQFAGAIRKNEQLFYPRGGEMTDIDIELPGEIVEIKLNLQGEAKKIFLKAQIALARGKALLVVYKEATSTVLEFLESQLQSQYPNLQHRFQQIEFPNIC